MHSTAFPNRRRRQTALTGADTPESTAIRQGETRSSSISRWSALRSASSVSSPGSARDHGVPPAGLPEREDLLAAAVEAARERGDRLRVAVVLEELVALEAQPGHDVGPDERLARVVEDPEDVARVDEQALEELEPARLEVLALVDDDRVVAPVGQRVDRRPERARERLVPPVAGDRVGARREDARLRAQALAQAVERRHVEAGRGRRLLELADEARREALVEADQERPVPLARQPTGLLGGEHRLPAARRADDLEPAQGPASG